MPLAVCLGLIAGCGGRKGGDSAPAEPAPRSFVLDDTAQGSVGTEVCASCHQEESATYRLTTHSRSFSVVDPGSEPADGEFRHEPSGRLFTVSREKGTIRHRDSLIRDGETLASAGHPLKYLVGSGKHSRSYLVDVDGFLLESPITWYVSRQCWDLSPGYEVPQPPGFERIADFGCVVCHVGRAEPIENGLHRLTFHELAIGCERCHGAGADHVRLARADLGEPNPGRIANPAKLDRQRAEDICAQCHLRGEATVFHPGHGPETFEPGNPLSTGRLDFFVAASRETMNVVGHVEQMRMSRCHLETETFTCTTCHDMHAPEPADRIAFYREKCLTCHSDQACGLPTDSPQRVAARDDCVSCHMPRGDTDIPHIAFTHHRVGIHAEKAAPPTETRYPGLPPLRAHQETADLPQPLLVRAEGLAYLEISASRESAEESRACVAAATRSLWEYNQRHPGDGVVEAALARLLIDAEPDQAARMADLALGRPELPAQPRINALLAKGLTLLDQGRTGQATEVFRELRRLRLAIGDLELLAESLLEHSPADASAAMQQAIALRPHDPDLWDLLAVTQERAGQKEAARASHETAAKIRQTSSR